MSGLNQAMPTYLKSEHEQYYDLTIDASYQGIQMTSLTKK